MPPWLSIALGVLGALATAYGLWAGGRKALADARAVRTPTTPYEALAARVMKLEESDATKAETIATQGGKIATLESKVTTLQQTEGRLVGWVARLHHGITDGSIPPLPDIPDWLIGLLARRPHDD